MRLLNLLPMKFRHKDQENYHDSTLNILAGKLSRLFLRPSFPVNSDGSKNLHLGCGSINHPAFINIDGRPLPHIHYVSRIDKLSQFQDESINLIYVCHCLEHFSHRHTLKILQEWRRILKKSGILRVSVPDFNSMVELYLATGHDIQYVLAILTGGQDHKYNYHMTIFNEEFLSRLFFEAGFVQVQKWTSGSSDMTTFDDWSGRVILFDSRSFPISLNLEAVK